MSDTGVGRAVGDVVESVKKDPLGAAKNYLTGAVTGGGNVVAGAGGLLAKPVDALKKAVKKPAGPGMIGVPEAPTAANSEAQLESEREKQRLRARGVEANMLSQGQGYTGNSGVKVARRTLMGS